MFLSSGRCDLAMLRACGGVSKIMTWVRLNTFNTPLESTNALLLYVLLHSSTYNSAKQLLRRRSWKLKNDTVTQEKGSKFEYIPETHLNCKTASLSSFKIHEQKFIHRYIWSHFFCFFCFLIRILGICGTCSSSLWHSNPKLAS